MELLRFGSANCAWLCVSAMDFLAGALTALGTSGTVQRRLTARSAGRGAFEHYVQHEHAFVYEASNGQ